MNATITNPFNLVIIIIGTFLGISLGLFLLCNKSAKNKANLYLGGLVLALVTYFIPAFCMRFELLESIPHVIGIHRLTGFLFGPLAYLYVRACTQKGFKMRPILWLHFLPFAIDVIFDMPFLLESGSEKIAYYFNLFKYGDLRNSSILFISKAMHAGLYYILALRLILQYRLYLNNSASSIDTAFHRWVLVFISILSLPILAQAVFVFTKFERYLVLVVFLSFFVFILCLYIAALVKPELFHAFPHQMPIPESSEEKRQKYESSNLQTDQKEKYIRKLLAFMELKKPYQSPELTLAELSEQVKIPAHYLSQVINEKLRVNFLDFINGYRIKAAQEMLVDIKMSHYTILAIAYEAGFNSKSTFYTAFKKGTGTTPSAYRKQVKVA